MLTPVPPTECMSAREAASARLDSEVSELDVARLDAHLLACAACRAYAVAIAGVAAELRAAPLEWPSHASVEVGISPRRMPVAAAAAAAVLVAAVTGSSFAVGRVLGARATPNRTAAVTADAAGLRRDSTQQHLLAMLNSFELAQPSRTGRMHAI
ncbi:MAG TPA: zf-HC2 domain-containing protein [Gaiellaceae bacterium]